MKALVGKNMLMKKQEKERNKSQHSLLSHLFLSNSRELKGTQGNSRELNGTQGNLKFFKGSARRSNGRKKTQVKEQRG